MIPFGAFLGAVAVLFLVIRALNARTLRRQRERDLRSLGKATG